MYTHAHFQTYCTSARTRAHPHKQANTRVHRRLKEQKKEEERLKKELKKAQKLGAKVPVQSAPAALAGDPAHDLLAAPPTHPHARSLALSQVCAWVCIF